MEQINKLKCGIIGATGMVGQRFITLLADHPYFEISVLAASARSAGMKYSEAVQGRWKMKQSIPANVSNMIMMDAADVEGVSSCCDFVFCAVDMPKADILLLEEAYARAETPVVSNNSANRWTNDVPMVIPEINPEHTDIIPAQRKRLGTTRGFIAVKPNCSIQSYVPAVTPLLKFGISKISVTTFQAISGAGKTFETFPEIVDNVIPYIGGEEEKTEKEPLKLWGHIENDFIISASEPMISATCIRVPVSDGHLASVSLSFKRIKPSAEDIISIWRDYKGVPQELGLPSAPKQFLNYFEEFNRPQTGLDRDIEKGMGISLGRLRSDNVFDYKFVGLSHNTLRGAAGGAVLNAELLYRKGYLEKK